MADSRRKAPSTQPWKYVSRLQAAQQNREALEVMTRAAKERLSTGDVGGAREAMAQASPQSVQRHSGSNIMAQVGKMVREKYPKQAFERDKKLVTNALADKARRIVSGDSKLVPAPTVEPPRIKKKDFSITRLAGDVSHYAAALNPVGNIVEGVDIARGKGDARERWLATISGEKFQDRLGIGTRYMDRLREQGLLGEVASGVIDTATAPSTYIPGVGPIGGGASVTSKVGAKILARRAAAELVGGGLGMPGARIAQEETAKHTDNPWLALGAGVAGGLIGGVGGYMGVEHAGGIARTGVRGAKAGNRGAEAADRALLRVINRGRGAPEPTELNWTMGDDAGVLKGGGEFSLNARGPDGTHYSISTVPSSDGKFYGDRLIRREGADWEHAGDLGPYDSAEEGVLAVEARVAKEQAPRTTRALRRTSAEAGEMRMIEPGEPLLHGTQRDFEGGLRPSEEGAQGAAGYVTHNIEPGEADLTKPGRNADVYSGAELGERLGDYETTAVGARTRIETPTRRLRSLLWRKPAYPEEIDAVRGALETPEQQAVYDDVLEATRQDTGVVHGYNVRSALEMAYADEFAEQYAAIARGEGDQSPAMVNKALSLKVNDTLSRAGIDSTTIDFTGYAETAVFDPTNLESYFDYAARAKARESLAEAEDALGAAARGDDAPLLEGDVITAKEWDQSREMKKAKVLFRVNPKAGKLLPGVTNPKQWVALQRKVFDMALAGEKGRFWYERSAKAILAAFHGDADEAEKMMLLIANFSPKAEPAPNMNMALRAWNQWQTNGVVEGVGTKRMDAMANRILSGEKLASNSGPKTNSFYTNMIGYVKPEAWRDVATVDRHMGTTYGVVPKEGSGGSVQLTPDQYKFIEAGLRDIGSQLGWSTDQVQAAVWVVEKSRKLQDQALGRALKTVQRREQKLLNAPEDITPKKRAGLEKSLAKAQEKAALLDEEAAQPYQLVGDSLYDFADALEEHVAQVAWETAPGANSGVLPGYQSWSLAEKMEMHAALSKIRYDENGVDLIAKMLGLPQGFDLDALGMFVGSDGKLEFNPGTQTGFSVPKAKATTIHPETGKSVKTGLKNTIDADARKLLNAYAAIMGMLNHQEATPWNTFFEPESAAAANAQLLSLGRTITDQELETLKLALGDGVVVIPRRDIGAGFINISGTMDSVATLDNQSFENLVKAKVAEALDGSGLEEVRLARAKHDGEYLMNDWADIGESDGQGYARWVSDAGPGAQGVWDWARRVLEPQVHATWADFGEKYGFTEAEVLTRRAAGNSPSGPSATGLSGESGSISAGWAAQLAGTAGGAAYGYSTGDDQEDRWKKALSFGVAGFVGGTTLRLAAGGMGGRAKSLPGPTPTPRTSVLASLPEEAIESRTVASGGRERINPKPGYSGADKALAIKQEAARAPGPISRALPPVLHKGAALLNPAKVMDLPVLVAWRARGATKVQLMGEFNTQMTPYVEAVEALHHQAIYKGPEVTEQRFKDVIGTWKDIFERPEMYDMTPALREAIDDYGAAAWDHVSGRAKAEYGVEVNPYTAQGKPDYVYLPTIAREADMDAKLDSALDGISTSRRAKTRAYQTAWERMLEDPDFVPETDLRQLTTTLNEAMAGNAGDSVLKRGAGGKSLAEVMDEVHPGLRKAKLRARASMLALNARAKEALASKRQILTETRLSDTEMAQVERRMEPITSRVDELTEGGEYGAELSYLSGQQRELEILHSKIMKSIATKEGRAAWQDVRYDRALADIQDARTQVEKLVRDYKAAGPGKYVQDASTHQWYTPEAAQTMTKLLSRPSGMGKGMFSILDEIRAWHLAGDFSPLTIQGVLGIVTDPMTAWKALRQVNGDPLKVLQRIQDQEYGTVSDFSFSTGRRFGLQMPDYYEQGAGTGRKGVGRIPGVGKVEDTMFAVIQIMQFNQWKNDRALLQGWNPGMSDGLAGQEAASTLGKMVPGMDPGERGISSTRGAVERAAITSSSFLAAPALAAADAGTGYIKLAKAAFERLARSNTSDPRTAWQTLSGREQLAIRRTFQATGTVMGLAAMSAALSAESRNMSVEDAIRETWDTDSRYFMAVQLGEGRSIPIGGPFRSAIRAIAPDRNGVPFGNLASWVGSKATSVAHLPLDLHANRDFEGDPIYEGNFMRPENIMRALWYGSEAVMPVALGEASESIRKGDRPLDETAMAVVTQFAGTSYTPVSPNEKLNELARGQYEGKDFYDLLPKQQDAIKKANPALWNQAVAKGSDERQQAEALKAEVKADQEADDKLLMQGKLSLDDWEKGRSDRQNQLVGAERAIYSDSNFTSKKTNPVLQEYYDAIDDATTNGRVDWDEVQAFRDGLSEKENKLIDENTGLRKTKLEKLRSQVSSEYYDLPRYRGYTADEARDIDAVWQQVRNNSRSADDAQMLRTLRTMDSSDIDPVILKAVRKRIIGTLSEDRARHTYARLHPEVAIIQRQGKLTPADVAAIEAAMR